jgi:hypothetical protein
MSCLFDGCKLPQPLCDRQGETCLDGRRLPAKNRRGSGWLEWSVEFVTQRLWIPPSERGRSSAGFMLMFACWPGFCTKVLRRSSSTRDCVYSRVHVRIHRIARLLVHSTRTLRSASSLPPAQPASPAETMAFDYTPPSTPRASTAHHPLC